MYGSRKSPLPPPFETPVEEFGQNMVEAVVARRVFSEKELRLALQEIAEEDSVAVNGEQGVLATVRPRAIIQLGAPFALAGKITVDVPGVEIRGAGFTPFQVGSLDVVFEVTAPFVTFTDIKQVTPAGDTPPTVFLDLDGATYFTCQGCYFGGQTAAVRSPSGSATSDYMSFHGYRGAGDFDILSDFSGFTDCHFGDFTLQTGSNYNRLAACLVDTIENNSNSYNVAAGCCIATVNNAGSSIFNLGTANVLIP